MLTSSDKSKLEGTPKEFSLDKIIGKKPYMKTYTGEQQNLALLLEGDFKSVYKNRVNPLKTEGFKDTIIAAKMIIIADGDVIKDGIKWQTC